MGYSTKKDSKWSKPSWVPMKHTQDILLKWWSKILKTDLSFEEVEELEQEILKGGAYHVLEYDSNNNIKYSDGEYSKKEAMVDFILAVCPYLSELSLYRFCYVALAKEKKNMDNTLFTK
ncbi:hypothetical protein [Legionella sainthelensi]|uniref:hypothetical protein n=1 Tax=Legionella sainthelensi TaxID=28087 RepID=UPI000E200F04|nr:hypothetical protein [Legionella sainthelensi]